MSVESIKKLVRCESEAKERLEHARREQGEMKAQASKDAKFMVEDLKKENEEKLRALEKEVEEYIKMVDGKLRAGMEDKIKSLNSIKNRKKTIDILVEHVSGINKK